MRAIIEFAIALAAQHEPAYEPEPEEPVSFLVEPIILGPDGWMVFENPSRQSLERSFAEGRDRGQLDERFSRATAGQSLERRFGGEYEQPLE